MCFFSSILGWFWVSMNHDSTMFSVHGRPQYNMQMMRKRRVPVMLRLLFNTVRKKVFSPRDFRSPLHVRSFTWHSKFDYCSQQYIYMFIYLYSVRSCITPQISVRQIDFAGKLGISISDNPGFCLQPGATCATWPRSLDVFRPSMQLKPEEVATWR